MLARLIFYRDSEARGSVRPAYLSERPCEERLGQATIHARLTFNKMVRQEVFEGLLLEQLLLTTLRIFAWVLALQSAKPELKVR